jgi:hypothetical protein
LENAAQISVEEQWNPCFSYQGRVQEWVEGKNEESLNRDNE